MLEEARQIRENEIVKKREDEARQKAAEAERAQRTAKRNKKIKIICLIAVVVAIVIAIISSVITKSNNAKAYKDMAGEFCVYRVINDDGEERGKWFNWWLSIGEDGIMKMSSWSYDIDNCEVDSYSGSLKNKADFRKLEDYRIEDYCADVSEYEKALYCYEFHIADEWDEFDGYIVCWQYHSGKIVDVYCDDYRFSFVETSDDYSFNKWEGEINADKLSKNVQKLIDDIDVSEENVIEEIEKLISSGNYDKVVEAIVDCKLSDKQKNTFFDSLVDKTDFKIFEVNGLVFHVPEHWFIREYSDPNIKEAKYSEDESLFFFYVKYIGTVDEVANEDNDYWKTRSDFSKTSISGCTDAYVRYDSGYDNNDEQYFVIEHYVECDGQVYQIQFLAYNDRYYVPEVEMLLARVEFTNYAQNRADIQEQKYLDAIELFSKGKYEEALSIFVTLEGYKESEQKITECNNVITDNKYNDAIVLINEGKHKDALVLLDEVGDYKDAVVLKQKYALLTCEVGDVITFGAYEQDNNFGNATEAIEWIVLQKNGKQMLVISKEIVEIMPYNNELTHTVWKNSTIRDWLNSTFYNHAFATHEQSYIVSVQISNPDDVDENNADGSTTDKIFLLSYNEADKYFSSDYDRDLTSPTKYAESKASHWSWSEAWLLRSPGNIDNVAYIDYDGKIGYYEDVNRSMGIRPAVWIEISE